MRNNVYELKSWLEVIKNGHKLDWCKTLCKNFKLIIKKSSKIVKWKIIFNVLIILQDYLSEMGENAAVGGAKFIFLDLTYINIQTNKWMNEQCKLVNDLYKKNIYFK